MLIFLMEIDIVQKVKPGFDGTQPSKFPGIAIRDEQEVLKELFVLNYTCDTSTCISTCVKWSLYW